MVCPEIPQDSVQCQADLGDWKTCPSLLDSGAYGRPTLGRGRCLRLVRYFQFKEGTWGPGGWEQETRASQPTTRLTLSSRALLGIRGGGLLNRTLGAGPVHLWKKGGFLPFGVAVTLHPGTQLSDPRIQSGGNNCCQETRRVRNRVRLHGC